MFQMETNADNVGIRRVTLRQLEPDFNNILIVGIMIAKQRPRRFNNPKTNESRAVWNFTLRDSPQDYVNVTFWGEGDLILGHSSNFHVGDVGKIFLLSSCAIIRLYTVSFNDNCSHTSFFFIYKINLKYIHIL